MRDVYIVSQTQNKRLQPNIPYTGDNKPQPKMSKKEKEKRKAAVISCHITWHRINLGSAVLMHMSR